jgi:hypothetical protein
MAIVKEEKIASVKQLNCTGCGNALSVLNPRAKYISCQYCGSVLDVNSEEHGILMSMSAPETHQPFSFVKVGMIAKFFDKKYQVIARTRWRQDYYEYWSEEGETGYSREIWIYDEWLLISEQRTYFYLVEDKDGFYISEEIIPEKPSLPPENSNRWSFMNNQRAQIIREYGAAEVVYFEGESNYQIKLNDTIQFASYKHRNIVYVAEWRIDETTDLIKEIEFFKEEKISKKEVMQAFEANEELDFLREKLLNWKILTYGSVALAALFFVLMIGGLGANQKTIFEESFNLESINEDFGIVSKPIVIEEAGLHCLKINGELINANTEAFVLAYFMDKDSNVVNYIDGDFGYYTGYDDGYWAEQEGDNEKLVKVAQPGTYYAKIMGDRDENVTGTIYLSIDSGVKIVRYYVFGWIIMGLLAVIFYFRMKRI